MKTALPLTTRTAFAAAFLATPTFALAEEASAPEDQATHSNTPMELAPQTALSLAVSVDPVDASTFDLAAGNTGEDTVQVTSAVGSVQAADASAQSGGASARGGLQMPKIVFDETWMSVGLGAGLVPSYGGSDDYILFPLPLIVGRVGGVGIRPNGPGIRLDLLSPAPSLGGNQKKAVFNFGPAVRFRNDRANQIEDEVVELAEDLDIAIEVGLAGGVTFSGVFNPLDSITFNTQVSFDVLGAHDGMLIEPTLGYLRPFGPGIQFSYNIGLQFADDNFADYYYSVTPAQSAATGLPLFTADGGLNSVSNTAILNFDLDGNALNGGLSIYTIVGYTRFVGDAANTPFTDIRGDANQFIGGVGVSYTF